MFKFGNTICQGATEKSTRHSPRFPSNACKQNVCQNYMTFNIICCNYMYQVKSLKCQAVVYKHITRVRGGDGLPPFKQQVFDDSLWPSHTPRMHSGIYFACIWLYQIRSFYPPPTEHALPAQPQYWDKTFYPGQKATRTGLEIFPECLLVRQGMPVRSLSAPKQAPPCCGSSLEPCDPSN